MPADNHHRVEVMADDQMPDLPADARFDGVGEDVPFFKRNVVDKFVGPDVSVGVLVDEELDGVHEDVCD